MSRPRALSVRTTPEFLEDLAVLQRAGLNASDAARHAVRLIAQAYRTTERLAQEQDGRRPAVLSIHTAALYPQPPYDGPDQHV